jgi:hypothetical protein
LVHEVQRAKLIRRRPPNLQLGEKRVFARLEFQAQLREAFSEDRHPQYPSCRTVTRARVTSRSGVLRRRDSGTISSACDASSNWGQ